MNKRSGITLVEVLVSITIFLSVFMGILSTFYLAEKRIARQEEYQYIENLCLDIDKIYDTEGYNGLVNRYGDYGFKTIEDIEDETSKSTTKDACESEDYPRTLESSSIETGEDEIDPTITDGNEESTKIKTYKVSITKTSYYVSYDKNIETTTTNYSASIEDRIYLNSNYQMVDSDSSYKYEITYSYSRKYNETKEVTTEKTKYEIGTIEGTQEITETWVKSSSNQESNTTSDDSSLDGYEKDENKTTKNDPVYTGTESFESNPNKNDENKITTITTKELDTSSVNLTISIKNVLNDYYVISDLEYGNSKYDVEYFKNYENKEVTINGQKQE